MTEIRKYDRFEFKVNGPKDGNPFLDVQYSVKATCGNRSIAAEGFYDGDGVYIFRIMPDIEGEWTFETWSNVPELCGITGGFTCIPAAEGVHGPVIVASYPDGEDRFMIRYTRRFSYADGTDYQPVGTTCYVWNLQGDELEEVTLETLKTAPFNKMRMCVFPKHYLYNNNEPPCYPFPGSREEGWDFTRFIPEYFRHLEMRIEQLGEMGIEADLILFHPYDNWGFQSMPHEVDIRYLRYIVARLGAYRNVWWSLANEWDLLRDKTVADWDDFFKTLLQYDPYDHLRSIHNCMVLYDHHKSWVTHVSWQGREMAKMSKMMDEYNKPVINDECCYEGNIFMGWGNITALELVNRMWEGFTRGGYVGHGETYENDEEILWWAKGGRLVGESPKRIAFLREVFAALPGVPTPDVGRHEGRPCALHVGEEYYLKYFGSSQQNKERVSLPEDKRYRAEVIDVWDCTVTPVEGEFSGQCFIPMPGKCYQALRITQIKE